MSINNLHNDEKEMLLRIAEGDEQAFSRLYDQYWDRIYSLARTYFKSVGAAEDIVQEVFLKVWVARKTLPEVCSFRPFLLVMARNMMISNLRKTVFHVGLGDEDNILPDEDFLQPDNQLTLKECERLLQEAVNALPSQQQRAYRLSRERCMSYDEIAEEMQISPLTVRTHISKALASIRQFLLNHAVHLVLFWLMLYEK